MLANACSTARSHEAATLSPRDAPGAQESVPSSPVDHLAYGAAAC
jgi:hypothetical protein